jgi:tRNA G18 (ribose-2'-O)-methylase SpoU
MSHKRKTRRERYKDKTTHAETFPISVATVNFKHEVNLAHVIRAAVCFGSNEVFVIGNYPSRKVMNELSGSLFDYIKVRAFPTTDKFIRHAEKNKINLVSIELPPEGFKGHSIEDYKFDFSGRMCLIVGHETTGVPVDILVQSDIVFIELYGAGPCLNTAQACNIALYETTKRYKEQIK